ncbi:phage integrase N-terminal SAM-like domain-containing protein [Candidatus Bipolaricaulota bacterium]|nr:phage integrase N-terminal SAM-like domain-containing protein [Candidatus Bipolaricaulota bacterium]
MELREAIEEFTLMAKVDGRSKKTIDLYDYVFGLFTDATEKTEIGDFRPKDIRKYLSFLMDNGLANTTVAIHYRVIKTLFNWLRKESYLDKNPIDPIDEPKHPVNSPRL